MKRIRGMTLCLAAVAMSAANAGAQVEQAEAKARDAWERGVALKGDAASARAAFRMSAAWFNEANRGDSESPARLGMEGAAWLLAGEVPNAIRAYRLGLAMAPDERSLQQGLELARSRVDYSSADDRAAMTPEPEPYAAAAAFLRCWGIPVLAISHAAGWACAGFWTVNRRRRWLVAAVLLIGAAGLLALGWVLDRTHRAERKAMEFAVVRIAQPLQRGDGLNFPPSRDRVIPAGVEVVLVQRRRDWLQVQLSDGTMGWLKRDGLLPLNEPLPVELNSAP